MALSMSCTSCKKQMEPFLDKKTEKVYCGLCNSEVIANHFLKIQLKTLKQYKEKSQSSFAVKCQNCSAEEQPKIVNKDVVCPNCNKIHNHLSSPFKLMLLEKLKTTNKDV